MSATVIQFPIKRRSFGSGRHMGLEDMVKDRSCWPALKIMVTTGQIEDEQLIKLYWKHPDFWRWISARIE